MGTVIRSVNWKCAKSDLVKLDKPMRFRHGGKIGSARYAIHAKIGDKEFLFPANKDGRGRGVPAKRI